MAKAKQAKQKTVTLTVQGYSREMTHEVTVAVGESVTIRTTGTRREATGRRLANIRHAAVGLLDGDEFTALLRWLDSLGAEGKAELGGILAAGDLGVAADWAEERGASRHEWALRWLDAGRWEFADVDFDQTRTFAVGEMAEHSSFNLSYFDPIKSITAKTVVIDDGNGKTKRLTLAQFALRNWDFDLAEARKRNSEYMD